MVEEVLLLLCKDCEVLAGHKPILLGVCRGVAGSLRPGVKIVCLLQKENMFNRLLSFYYPAEHMHSRVVCLLCAMRYPPLASLWLCSHRKQEQPCCTLFIAYMHVTRHQQLWCCS